MVTNGQTATETTPIIAMPLPISLIDPSALNRHSADEDADIAELAQTIAEHGLIAPITTRPMDGGRYEIVCGERRWRAFRLLERETIPCVVKDLDDTQAQIERIVENFQRRDPSFMEQGEAVAALLQLTDRDVSEVASRLGQSVSWVRRRAKLPNLIPAWREELAKDGTPYFAVRDSIEKLEEIAVLPPATQQTILDTKVLRYVKTTREMRSVINKLFMNLEAKPWTREWEKKAFSGSGKKRCDACMKRSDRENALFADPDDPNSDKKMCLDPACWQSKCLSWCKSLISDNPGMVPMRQGYNWNKDNLGEFFGVKPLSSYDWEERDEAEEREGYAAAFGVVVDGPEIGTTKPIWMEAPTDDGDESNDDDNVSAIHHWRENSVNRHRERAALAELIAADITAYLADIGTHAAIPAAHFADRQLRAGVWFGISGYVNSEEENTSPGDPDWNPLAWAWEQIAERIALYVADIAAEDIAQLYNGDRDYATHKATAAAFVSMFSIPLDMIATRATDTLYTTTHAESEPASDTATEAAADNSEAGMRISADDADYLTDPSDSISIKRLSYFPVLAGAQ